MTKDFYKLDNPAWYALRETHAPFSIGNDICRKYQPSIVSFVAYDHRKNRVPAHLDGLVDVDEAFFIIGNLPELPAYYSIESVLPCVQMICTTPVKVEKTTLLEKLGEADELQMNWLINLVQPGYYKPGTRLMGDYFGIRQDGHIVSITGERMRMNDFTEISAVVTHPNYSGRKYAQQLVAHVANKNLEADIIPFLHVAETNIRAINIYKFLGFSLRRIIPFTRIKRTG